MCRGAALELPGDLGGALGAVGNDLQFSALGGSGPTTAAGQYRGAGRRDRRYLLESVALLNPPASTGLEPKTPTPDTTSRKEVAATA